MTSSNLISYHAERDLLPLILAQCNYSLEVGRGTLVQYNWEALERQLIDRFIRGRPLVDFKVNFTFDCVDQNSLLLVFPVRNAALSVKIWICCFKMFSAFEQCYKACRYNLGQNLLRHITRIPIFFHSPWQKCLLSQIKRLFLPSPIAMLFAVTQEMHAWAVKPKQHCTREGEGSEFVSFGHDGTMARNWKLYWNVSTVLSGVVAVIAVFLKDFFNTTYCFKIIGWEVCI